MSEWNPALGRRRRRGGGGGPVNGLFTNIASFSGAPGATSQLIVRYGLNYATGTDVTSNALTSYSSADITKATVDAPTLTSISPTSITQGTTVTVTLTGTNARTTGQTLGGVVSSGLSQSAFTQVNATTWTVSLTATAGATPGTDGLFIVDTNHGNSGTQTLTVNTSSSYPAQLVMAWESDLGRDVNTNGAGVGVWTDQIAGKQWTQATAGTKPTNVNATLNGKNVLAFNGSQWFTGLRSAMGTLMNTVDSTVYLVVGTPVHQSAVEVIMDNRDTTGSKGYTLQIGSGNDLTAYYYDNVGTLETALDWNTDLAFHTVSMVMDHTTAANCQGFHDNGLSLTGTAPYAAQSAADPVLGARVTLTLGFIGQIAGFYVSSGADNSTQRSAMASYILGKWNV